MFCGDLADPLIDTFGLGRRTLPGPFEYGTLVTESLPGNNTWRSFTVDGEKVLSSGPLSVASDPDGERDLTGSKQPGLKDHV